MKAIQADEADTTKNQQICHYLNDLLCNNSKVAGITCHTHSWCSLSVYLFSENTALKGTPVVFYLLF